MPKHLGPPASTVYCYPPLCVRCGSPNPTTTGQIRKQNDGSIFRFIRLKAEPFSLTVPVCVSYKAILDKHTVRAALLARLGLLLGGGGVMLLGYRRVDWLTLLLAAYWGAALTSRLLVALYRHRFHDLQGTTWPQLCSYEEKVLTFKQPEFNRQFLQLNLE